MTSFVPPKKGAAFTTYVSLFPRTATGVAQANPTLATGDVKVAKDDGAPANLATLPEVDADFTKRVKVVLSSDEMDADNVTIIFSDAAGAEWCDLSINLQTAVNQVDDLATEIAAIKAKTDNLDALAQDVADVPVAVWDELTGGHEVEGSFGVALIESHGWLDTIEDDAQIAKDNTVDILTDLAVVDNIVDAIKAKTDNLPSDPADDSDIDAQLATIAGYIDTEIAAIVSALSTVGSNVTSVKAKTDSLNFGVTGKVDANVTHINEIEIAGSGVEDSDEWRPA